MERPKLTKQEVRVLALRAEEKSIAEIGQILVIEETTVKFHLANIYDKLGIKMRSRSARLLKIQEHYKKLSQSTDAPDPELEELDDLEQSSEPSPTAYLLVLEDEVALLEKEKSSIQLAVTPIPQIDEKDTKHHRRRIWALVSAILLGMFLLGIGVDRLIVELWNPQRPIATVATTATSSTPTIAATLPVSDSILLNLVSDCGEAAIVPNPNTPTFLREQGVNVFNIENTVGGVHNNFIRSLTINSKGLWIGYFRSEEQRLGGLGLYTGQNWMHCANEDKLVFQSVNDVVVDQTGQIWVATEQSGIFVFDTNMWKNYTTEEGLPSNTTYSLTIDDNSKIWAATSEGVASYDGEDWEVPYSATNNTLFHSKVHAIAFDHVGNIWVGHIHDGVSLYDNSLGKWVYLTTTNGLGGNQIREIIVRNADASHPESIWFATYDGGISKFEQGEWTIYRAHDGLPSNQVTGLALDKYNRIWGVTSEGVAYLEGTNWKPYHRLATLSVAMAPDCYTCPFEEGDHIWTGTANMGLTHSRLPYLDNENVIKVDKVCFELLSNRERNCVSLAIDGTKPLPILSASYPTILTPGEKLRFEISVMPRTPYQLREDRGDFLSNIDENETNLMGGWPLVPVKGKTEPGQPYTFINYDTVFTVPELADGELEHTFVNSWRVWMHTRYVGPVIRLSFTVRQNL